MEKLLSFALVAGFIPMICLSLYLVRVMVRKEYKDLI